jgi:hypothetical protein
VLLFLLLGQAGLGVQAADAYSGGSLSCKDSLLVGWGGVNDQGNISAPILEAAFTGSTMALQGCTLQLHPDSSYHMPANMMFARDDASITLSGCKLVGPAPGKSSDFCSYHRDKRSCRSGECTCLHTSCAPDHHRC